MRRLIVCIGVLLVTSPLWAQVSANLSWTNPTAYEDGSPLPASDIVETRITIALSPGGPAQFVETAPGAVTFHETQPVLTPGTWYFRTQPVAANGEVGEYSNELPLALGGCNPCRPRPQVLLSVLQ